MRAKTARIKTRLKPGKYPRIDPFQRALNLARKKYEKAGNELAKAREKIARLQEEMPGLQSVIAGLEAYFAEEPSVLHVTTKYAYAVSDANVTATFDETEKFIETPPPPSKKPSNLKPGTPQLYVCGKCGSYTASTDVVPICSNEKCGSRQLTLKQVPGPERGQPNGAGGAVIQTELPSTGDDDHFLTDNLPGKAILP